MDKMKVLITGGNGFVGQWLTEYLFEAGHDVFTLSRTAKQTPSKLPIQHLQADIRNLKQCKDALKGNKFQGIVHIASANNSNDPDFIENMIKTNVLGTRNILESVNLDHIKNFIYLSTFHVYGTIEGVVTEESKVSPKNDYAISHFFAEEYIRQFHITRDLPFTILRLTNGYGCPKASSSANWNLLINDLAKSAFKEKKITLNSNAQDERDFIWLGTACEVINKILLLNKAPNDTFNLANEKTYKLLDIARIVKNTYEEYSGNFVALESKINKSLPGHRPLNVSSTKLKQIIQYESPNKLPEEVKDIFSLLKSLKL